MRNSSLIALGENAKDKVRNMEGMPSFKHSLETDFIQILLCNTLSANNFYMSQKSLAKESVDVHKAMLLADTKFALKAYVYARNIGFMRTQPILGLALYCSVKGIDYSDTEEAFGEAFKKVIRTPDDLIDFVSILLEFRGLGSLPRRHVNAWLLNMTPYHAVKYSGGHSPKKVCIACGRPAGECGCRAGAKTITPLTLEDVIRLAHPKAEAGPARRNFDYILKGEIGDAPTDEPDALSIFKAFKMLLTMGDVPYSSTVMCKLIESGKLPHEVITGRTKLTAFEWTALFKSMPVLAALRNINTAERQGVSDSDIKEKVEEIFSPEVITRAKVLPHQIFNAYLNTNVRGLSTTFEKGIKSAFSNVKNLPGSWGIYVDKSGSMSSDSMIQKAALFALIIAGKSDYKFVKTFNSNIEEVKNCDIEKGLENPLWSISNLPCFRPCGGTTVSRCFDDLLNMDTEKLPDNAIILTDEQYNGGMNLSRGTITRLRQVNPNFTLYIINVNTYTSHIAPADIPGVVWLFGWNDAVIRALNMHQSLKNLNTKEHYRQLING